ncbi:MAG TPA: hypothetical protein DHV36_19245 [Desulfobacteraceae bacterium]|nr:hypothetical protein [Desulfobacteraceae bacterium]|tara:strand:- start:1926 stop:2354 length:429 start_codon:yes stop_codon:yes gene_type:complete
MKSPINKIGIVSSLIISALITIPGVYAFYLTDWKNNTLSQGTTQMEIIPEFQEDSRIFDRRIVLRKDKSITVNRSRLVFKGVKDDLIHMDVYLLELDPDYAYPHYISQSDPQKLIRLGDSTFQFLKISRGTLQLKIVDLYKS